MLKPFVSEFAHLVWLLVHRASATDDQQAALRRSLAAATTAPHEITVTELNIAVAQSARAKPQPVDLPWISELSLRMSGHSVRAIAIDGTVNASDLLGLARSLVQPSVPGDEGEAFDTRFVSLGLNGISVAFGREGFVRHSTPLGVKPIASPARTPFSVAAIAATPVRTATPPPVRSATPIPVRHSTPDVPALFGYQGNMTTSAAVGAEVVTESVSDDTNSIYEAALSNGNLSREFDRMLARIDAQLTGDQASKVMEEVARAAEERADDGRWVDVVEIARRLIAREEKETDHDVKRATVQAVRRFMKPTILRGMAHLLPRRRELRDDIINVLTRSAETGADVLIDLLVSADTAAERRAYRVALTHCPAATPALTHLLGDARWFVVRNAAELLGEMGVSESDARLVQVARHADARVRRAAAGALSRLGTPRSLHALQQLVADKTPAVRLQAAIGLGSMHNSRAVPNVIAALETEEDPDVQAALIGALGGMPTPESIARLKRAAEPGSLMHRKPTSVRLQAVQALADAGTEAARSVLRAFANDRDKEVRAKVDRLLTQRS